MMANFFVCVDMKQALIDYYQDVFILDSLNFILMLAMHNLCQG